MSRSFAQMTPATQHPRLDCAGVVPRWRVTVFTLPLCGLLSMATIAGAVFAGAMFAGTASAASPADEIAAAQTALARAERADAEQFDPESLMRARDALARAQAERRTDDAVDAAQLSEAEADLAYARSLEAAAQTRVVQRRNELRELRMRLDMEGGR